MSQPVNTHETTRPTPIIMVVAPARYLDAAEREFTHRYSADYRISAASSAAEALERAEHLQRDGCPVALFAVALDLPDAGFEEAVPRLSAKVPTARRAALVMGSFQPDAMERMRHAQQDGLIDAGLHLPRGQRDEEFHTAVTELLSEWGVTSSAPLVPFISIVTDTYVPHLMKIKDFLTRMGVPYEFVARDSEFGQQVLAEAGPDAELPVLRTLRGDLICNPDVTALAEHLYGRASDLPEGHVADLIVIGSGPAGLAAAVYGASEGLSTLVVESGAVGGQAGTSSMIRNYLGFPRGISGMRLAQRARSQADRFGARFLVGRAVEALRPHLDAPHEVVLAGGHVLRGRAVVIATGADYRRLGVPAIEEFTGRGVYYGAAMALARGFANQRVFIVGGGNSAGQAALHMARFTPHVSILVRRPGLEETMSNYLIREIEANPRVQVETCTEVVGGGASDGENRLGWLELRDSRTGGTRRVDADAMMLLLGAKPCADWIPQGHGGVDIDEHEFILTGRDVPQECWIDGMPPASLATSFPGIFAVGDIRSGSMKRVASASGEGAAVVPLVHQWLDDQADAAAAAAPLP